ncbi:MAG: endonuclease/exonuclease/phosphatase family protein [Bacteroidales bacterium]
MMKSGMRFLKPVFYLVAFLAGAFMIFLAYAWVDDYRPEEKTVIEKDDRAPVLPDTSSFSLLIWNIGYAGLDASMDFFYDGGRQMRPDEEGVLANLKGIVEILSPYRESDFVMLQEVDLNSKRSYHHDQVGIIEGRLTPSGAWFGLNYKVAFVPIPVKEPMGKVNSGLLTLSTHTPSGVIRHSFPGNYAWPMKLFMLDRCFLVSRFPLNDGKELLVVNTHNSAYDDGTLRKQQMAYLKEFLLTEYAQGNYLIVGGDWNQSPYGLPPELPFHQFDTLNLTYIEEGYPAPGWTWAYDPGIPTNRRVTTPYDPATSLTTIIDYYLVSPNIKILEVSTLDLDFKYSDHQPVTLDVKLIAG